MAERKLFLQIQSFNIMYPNAKNMIVMPITKRMEIIMHIQVCLLARMNFDFQQNGGKKSFSCKSKTLVSCMPMRGT